MTLPDYLDISPSRRTRCPYCDSSDGLAVYHTSQSRQYPTGGFYCFACLEGGDGLRYVVDAEHRTFDEALAMFGLSRIEERLPDWAYRGSRLKRPPLVLVDKADELQRAAQRRLRRIGATAETMQACRDLVWLRDCMTLPEREVWHANQRHGALALPMRLRSTDAVRRLDAFSANIDSYL